MTWGPEVRLLKTRLRKEPEDIMGSGFPVPQNGPYLLLGFSLTVTESITPQLRVEEWVKASTFRSDESRWSESKPR